MDFSRPLIEVARRHFAAENIDYLIGDAIELEGVHDRYDAVLVSAAWQHFSPAQAIALFRRLHRILKPGGRLVLGDVADGDRKWNFYRGMSGRARYVWGAIRRRPIIGYWWAPAALHRIAIAEGWTLAIHYQSEDSPNHYFRYDAVLVPAERAPNPRNGV
jgi:SAM-dependent methyltransferase